MVVSTYGIEDEAYPNIPRKPANSRVKPRAVGMMKHNESEKATCGLHFHQSSSHTRGLFTMNNSYKMSHKCVRGAGGPVKLELNNTGRPPHGSYGLSPTRSDFLRANRARSLRTLRALTI